MRYVRIYADSTGESHFEDVEIALDRIPNVSTETSIRVSAFNPAQHVAFACCTASVSEGLWQTVPRHQFLFVLAGEAEIELSDGAMRRFASGSVLLFEDTSGKGHKSSFVGTNDALLALVELPS